MVTADEAKDSGQDSQINQSPVQQLVVTHASSETTTDRTVGYIMRQFTSVL